MPRYFHERGKNHEDVLERIQKKYGDRARILMHKIVPGPGILGMLGREQVEYSGYLATGEEARTVQKNRDDENRAAILTAAGKTPPMEKPPLPADTSGTSEAALGEVLKELRDLKGSLAIAVSPPPEPFPHLEELAGILEDNDFDQAFIRVLIENIRKTFPAAELDNRNAVHEAAVEYIADSLSYYRTDQNLKPRIFILVGPTGVGKTTTIAKLAAVHGLKGEGTKVRIFTVDSFRIGAKAQVETYGEIMGIPVTAIYDYDDLRKNVALASEDDLVLVDTIGKSPKDVARLEEMKQLLLACGEDAEVHLALSSTTKTADLREIMKQFEYFEYRSVILTKLDETSRVGNLISAIAHAGIPLSYLTNGQSVPLDIAVASPGRLLEHLKGLNYDRFTLDNRYPAADITAAWR